MAFRKTLSNRIFNPTNLKRNFTRSIFNYHPSIQNLISSDPSITIFNHEVPTITDSCRNKFLRRNFQKREIGHSTHSTVSPQVRSLPVGEKLIEKLKTINVNKDRLRLDGLTPPPVKKESCFLNEITVKDAKKLLKLAQLEMLKSTLKQIQKKNISYSEFIEICIEGSNSHDQGLEFAKMLDDSGSVIVLGKIVFLHPEEVTQAIGGIIPLSISEPNDPRKKELEKMEKEKEEIDGRAEVLVRRELWAGLCLLMAQTAGFVRLTFWELSWDVMEPICFYFTSIYFIAGYTFFLRTSKEPSFQGFFESRFSSKQKELMKKKKFDIKRYNELKRICYPSSSSSSIHHQFEMSNLIGDMHY